VRGRDGGRVDAIRKSEKSLCLVLHQMYLAAMRAGFRRPDILSHAWCRARGDMDFSHS
jgi:hypothetical protein